VTTGGNETRTLDLHDIQLEIGDGVAVVTLDRPDVRNVISDDPLMTELIAACAYLDARTDIRVVIVTGSGSAFSAGGNVTKMRDREGMFAGPPDVTAHGYQQGIQRLIRAVHGLRAVTIAAVNGPAIGAGFDLALACDLRLCARSARFGETFVNLGLIPGDGGSWLLPRVVGYQRAAELSFTGRVFGADEALALGVVLSVHDDVTLLDETRALAATIATKPGFALRSAKQLLRRWTDEFADVLDAAAPLQALLHETSDHRAAVEAFGRPER
jgi:enoyl-CoA hydratase/carnithine racemase